MENYKISVIIPMYNVEKQIPYCLNSILNQTYSNWECIIVDDGSTDNSCCVCQEFVGKDHRFHLYKKTNGGPGDSRNYGIGRATGDYIAFIDSDDWVDDKYFEIMVNEIKDDEDVIMCHSALEYPSGTVETLKISEPILIFSEADRNKLMFYSVNKAYGHIFGYELGFLNTMWGKLYKRSLIEKHHIRNYKCKTEDQIFNFEVFANLHQMKIIDKILYHYNMREGSVTKAIKNDFVEGFEIYLFHLREVIDKYCNNDSEFKTAYKSQVAETLYMNVLKNYYFSTDYPKEMKKKRNIDIKALCARQPWLIALSGEADIIWPQRETEIGICLLKHRSFLLLSLLFKIRIIAKKVYIETKGTRR